jgi:hypothetical protein
MRKTLTCLAGFAIAFTLASLAFHGLHAVARINEAKADVARVMFWHCGPAGHEWEKVCHADQ